MLEATYVTTWIGLRARALIALVAFSFARVGAALTMRVEDVLVRNRRLKVRLRGKVGKAHPMPRYHSLEDDLIVYLQQACIMHDGKGLLFRMNGRGTVRLIRLSCPKPTPTQ